MGMLCMNLYSNPFGMMNEKIIHLYPQVHSQHFAISFLYFWVAVTLELLKVGNFRISSIVMQCSDFVFLSSLDSVYKLSVSCDRLIYKFQPGNLRLKL